MGKHSTRTPINGLRSSEKQKKKVDCFGVSTAGDAVTAASVIPDIDTAGPSNVSVDGSSTSTTRDIFKDEMMTIADTLVAIRSTRPRTTSVVIRDVEEEPRRHHLANDAALIEQMEDVQARMDADILLKERLQQEEREQFTIEEKSRMLVDMIAERKRFFAAQRAAEQRSKPPTKSQMEEIGCVNSFIPMDSEVVKDSGKKDDSSSKEAGKKELWSKLNQSQRAKVMKEQESAVDDADK
ncbi:hypothetical protein Tco_0013130 [Tanacetum coccineum]